MNTKKLKFLAGGLALEVFATVLIFAASPSHAQANEALDYGKEIVSTTSKCSCEMHPDTKDFSQECVTDKNCNQVCKLDVLTLFTQNKT